MSWASRRRTMYVSGIVAFLVVLVGIPTALFLYEAPTCFDGILNQGERGIDRGGPCVLLDESQVQNVAVLWSRSFEVIPGFYNAVARIDNPNFSAGAVNVPYSFKLFDSSNILIAERQGITYLAPNDTVSIFEGAIETGRRVPTRTFFEFLEEPAWERVEDFTKGLGVESRVLRNQETLPRIDAVISNITFEDIFDIEIIATVFDVREIAIASSRTVIEVLPQQSSQAVTFTWPQRFSSPASRIEISPQVSFR